MQLAAYNSQKKQLKRMGMDWLSKELLLNTLNMRQYWKWDIEKEKQKSANLPLIIQMSDCSHPLVVTFSSSILNRSRGLNFWGLNFCQYIGLKTGNP